VPNLQVFFSGNGQSLPVSSAVEDYLPGDLVTWILPGNLPHIGIVTDQTNRGTGHPLVAHNIGVRPVLQDMLFAYQSTGHYRYSPHNPH
jgi:uncharacterized protein YijF (DUF1287 family)